MNKLTSRQQAVLDFIGRHLREYGRAPTIREIGAHFGLKSPHGVIGHLQALEKKGFLKRDPVVARGIRLTGSLPLVGEVSAGPLLEAIEQATALRFIDLFGNDPDAITFKVAEDGTVQPHIRKGDLLLLRAGLLIGLIRVIDRFRFARATSGRICRESPRASTTTSAECQQSSPASSQQVASKRRRASPRIVSIDDGPRHLTRARGRAYASSPGTTQPIGRGRTSKRSAFA